MVPGIDVEIGVELLDDDPETAALEQAAQRGGRDALAERRNDATCDEDVLSHALPSPRWFALPGGAWPCEPAPYLV